HSLTRLPTCSTRMRRAWRWCDAGGNRKHRRNIDAARRGAHARLVCSWRMALRYRGRTILPKTRGLWPAGTDGGTRQCACWVCHDWRCQYRQQGLHPLTPPVDNERVLATYAAYLANDRNQSAT